MKSTDSKTRAALISVISNSTLVFLKLVIGLLMGSVSVISEAIHSGVDLLASFIALFAVRQSSKPADQDHPFGHGKYENMSGTIEALLILVAAGWILDEAIRKFSNPQPMKELGLGVGIMLISSLMNMVVSRYLFRVAKKTDSLALEADAWHLRTDIYTSAGVMLGLIIIWIGGWIWPSLNLQWVDPVAAIIVALLIIKAAYELTVKSARDLIDVSLPAPELQWIRSYLGSLQGRILGFHHLRTRKSGAHRFVEFHLLVDPKMSVEEAHVITDELSLAIRVHFEQAFVNIHVEPCLNNCTPHCLEGCLISESGK